MILKIAGRVTVDWIIINVIQFYLFSLSKLVGWMSHGSALHSFLNPNLFFSFKLLNVMSQYLHKTSSFFRNYPPFSGY